MPSDDNLLIEINAALRSGDQEACARLDSEIQRLLSDMDKLPVYDRPVVYGEVVSPDVLNKMLARYEPGTTIREPGFVIAKKKILPPGSRIQFLIYGGNPRDLSSTQDLTHEDEEVIFPPGTRFTIDRHMRDGRIDTWLVCLKAERN